MNTVKSQRGFAPVSAMTIGVGRGVALDNGLWLKGIRRGGLVSGRPARISAPPGLTPDLPGSWANLLGS
ncbi:MAG: hypothetical protein LBK71_02525 [Verrucomicrobiales bacterium]|nr:hypothetical protein [Verrucomicrobiales bacterium]